MDTAIGVISLQQELTGPMVLVFFIYGLAFFTLGIVLTLASRQESSLPIVPSLWLLALFGILHGIHEWIEMFGLLAPERPQRISVDLFRIGLLAVSFLFLAAFGADSLQRSGLRRSILWVPMILPGIWVASVLISSGLQTGGLTWLDEADVLARYLLAIPGALLAATALMAQQRDFRKRGMPGFGRDLVWATTALIIYGVVGQLFVRRSDLFPSTIINSELFLAWFGIPVQTLRALAAVCLTLFTMRALRAFEEESRRRLSEAAQSEVEAREQLLATERAAGQEREELNRLLSTRACELGLLLDLSNLLSHPKGLSASLEAALKRVVGDLAFCDAALVLLADESGNPERMAASTGYRTQDLHAPESRFGPSITLGRHAFGTGRSVCRHADGAIITFDAGSVLKGEECWGYASPSILVALPLTGNTGLRDASPSLPASPATPDRQCVGAIVFARDRANTASLTVDDLHLMQGITQQIEQSLETARLYTEAQEREQTLAHLLRQVVGAQEAERRRIARELHDATGQSLSAIAMGLRGLANAASQPSPGSRTSASNDSSNQGKASEETEVTDSPFPHLLAQAESLQAFATDALRELRRIIADLRPPQLDDLGLAAALRWYTRNLGDRYPDLQITFTAPTASAHLPPHYDTVIFRVAQEALTNVVRHAHATQIHVQLEVKPSEVVLTVQDNGTGFDPARVLGGRGDTATWGLLGMRERALLLGGHYEFKSAPGQGTMIHLSVPRPSPSTATPRNKSDNDNARTPDTR